MNIKIEKKLYTAPKMSVLEMCEKVSLLADSGSMDGAPEVEDYDGELGFVVKGIDRKA